jgi:hypothetical protein
MRPSRAILRLMMRPSWSTAGPKKKLPVPPAASAQSILRHSRLRQGGRGMQEKAAGSR